MSAWIVSKEHINVMIAAGLQYGRSGWHGNLSWRSGDEGDNEYRELTRESADEVGRMLWRENVRSIEYLYPDTAENGDYPGPISFEREQADEYVYTPPRIGDLSPGETFNLVACFDYQSCETDDWTETEAYRFCKALEDAVAASMYEGPWGWDAEEIAKRRAMVTA